MSKACCPPPPDQTTGSCPPPAEADSSCCPPPEQTSSSPCCPPEPTSDTGCCPSSTEDTCCPAVADDRPGYKLWPFVCGWLETAAGPVPQVASRLTRGDLFGRWQMRWGMGRMRYSIAPGLYAVGTPDADSPVLVTANYKMTFDIVRHAMAGHDAWLLVLDTKGINVWCAAGKGTFGTAEIVRRSRACRLDQVVNHRRLIVPQLGAPGVAAHQVQKETGFQVRYGPVRATDLPTFLTTGQATTAMRRVTFTTLERLVLTPVELVGLWKQVLWGLLVLFLLGGVGPEVFSVSAALARGGLASLAGLAGVLSGAVLAPLLLPWLPGRMFAFKGAVVGIIIAFLAVVAAQAQLSWLNSLAVLLALPAVSSWCAMNFTGSTPFTSPSGVEKEMRQAIPAQAAALLVAGVCWIAAVFWTA